MSPSYRAQIAADAIDQSGVIKIIGYQQPLRDPTLDLTYVLRGLGSTQWICAGLRDSDQCLASIKEPVQSVLATLTEMDGSDQCEHGASLIYRVFWLLILIRGPPLRLFFACVFLTIPIVTVRSFFDGDLSLLSLGVQLYTYFGSPFRRGVFCLAVRAIARTLVKCGFFDALVDAGGPTTQAAFCLLAILTTWIWQVLCHLVCIILGDSRAWVEGALVYMTGLGFADIPSNSPIGYMITNRRAR